MYLRIRNPGVADYQAMSILGVSTTRYNNLDGSIGTFGSGLIHAIRTFLHAGITPYIITGNLHMEFGTKVISVDNRPYKKITVKYSGKTQDGRTKNDSEEWNISTDWGTADWTQTTMALREVVSNAIDGSLAAGKDYKAVEMDIVDEVRAKANHTAVFLPITPDITMAWQFVSKQFLHFSEPHLLNKSILPRKDNSDKAVFYKKGVLVACGHETSCFNYNFQNLRLDESRNATDTSVRVEAAKVLSREATVDELAHMLKKCSTDINCDIFERYISSYDYIVTPSFKERLTAAFKKAFGEMSVAGEGKTLIDEFARRKGYHCATLPRNLYSLCQACGVLTVYEICEGLNKEGLEEFPPTADMVASLKKVWNMLESFGLTQAKLCPPIKSFAPIMSGEAQTFGLWKNNIVYIHNSITAGPLMDKVVLEELSHCITGAGDVSRDLQDFLFNLIVKIAF